VLGVAGRPAGDGGGAILVYAATRTLVCLCSDAFASQPRLAQLDGHGVAGPRCTALTGAGEFCVARPEALFFYAADGRGACLLMPGEKRRLQAFGGNMLLLVSAAAAAPASPEEHVEPHAPVAGASMLSLYDVRSKLLAYQAPLGECSHIFCSPRTVVLFLAGEAGPASGSAFALRERDTPAKVALLVQRGLFPNALELLGLEEAAAAEPEARRATAAARADVRRRFGEHLYAKRDFDGALAQFVATIGSVPPSLVIRLFLEARRLPAVISYLEALHAAQHAAPEHTTLLLHCYAAEKETAKLDAFLAEGGPSGAGDDAQRYRERFDVPTVLRVCRSAGYPAAALGAASRAGRPGARLAIMLDDLGLFDDALSLLGTLPPAEQEEAVAAYGRRLLCARPAQTAELLLRLVQAQRGAAGLARAAQFIPLFSERPRLLRAFLQAALAACGEEEPPAGAQAAAAAVHNTLLELLLSERLVSFAAPPPGGEAAAVDEEEGAEEAEARSRAALRFLRDAWPAGRSSRYDPSHALVLCQTRRFTPGLLFLYERLRMFSQLMACHMAAGDSRGLLDAAVRLGGREPGLWHTVLQHFGSLDPGARREEALAAVRLALAHVEKGRLLPPLAVLQALSGSEAMPLAVVKDYVRRSLAEEAQAVAEDRAACERYEAETARMRAETAGLRRHARVFQNNRCSLCTQTLDLPAAHFMCMHSFHSRCLGESDKQCPVCAPENRAVAEVKAALAAAAADQDRFFQTLENSEDGFSVVAESFGRFSL